MVSFAGPYFVAGQDLLVTADNDDIKGPDDLAGKNVCSATGSTPIERMRVSDGPRRRSAGVKQSSVVVSFGDGKRARHKARLRHRYAAGGSYRVVVKASDRAGNHITIKRRVRVR